MSFKERLQRAAAHAKVDWSPTAIGQSLGLPKQTVARWMDKGEPSGKMLYLIADRWKVSARWLATNEGNMLPGEAALAAREPAATYSAPSDRALEIARAWAELSPVCQEHVHRQIELLRGSVANDSGRRRAVQHDVEIRDGTLKLRARKKTRKGVR